MLATIRDSENLEILTGQLSQFLAWHRLRKTDGFSLPLMALWVGPIRNPPGQPPVDLRPPGLPSVGLQPPGLPPVGLQPPGLPPVRESVGVSGSWTVYKFEDEELSRRELMVALSEGGSNEESPVSHPSVEETGRVVPVMPHDLRPPELLKVLSDMSDVGGQSSSEYVLQHCDTGRLLSSRECRYHIRPLL